MKSDRVMDAKLNHSDLSVLLAKEVGISQTKAELLTKTFFDIIIEGLEQDGSVKINSLGTFKITDVASRSSVNVNTGEKFEIKGHGKLSFIPADALKEAVNQPFAMFEPVEVDETYSEEQLAEGDSDIVGTETAENETVAVDEPQPEVQTEEAMAEIETEETVVNPMVIEEEMPAETPVSGEPMALNSVIEEEQPFEECAVEVNHGYVKAAVEEPVVEAATVESVESQVAEPVEEPVEEPVKGPAAESVEEKVVEPVVVKSTELVIDYKVAAQVEPVAVKKQSKGFGRVLFTLLILLAVVGGLVYGYYHSAEEQPLAVEESPVAEVHEEIPADTATVQAVDATTEATMNSAVESKELSVSEDGIDALAANEVATGTEYSFKMVAELESMLLANITVADTTLYACVGELTKHKVSADETLTRISLNYFGDKRLWPYIVKYNNLAKPNDLCKGMEISIPMLEPLKCPLLR